MSFENRPDSLRLGQSTLVLLLMTLVFLSFVVSFVPSSRAAATWNVSIVNFAFQPDDLEIDVGDTVVWWNNSTSPHTVTESENAWTSGTLTTGETYSHTFDSVGIVDYYCTFHPTMTGSIFVGLQIPEFSSAIVVITGLLALMTGVIVIKRKR